MRDAARETQEIAPHARCVSTDPRSRSRGTRVPAVVCEDFRVLIADFKLDTRVRARRLKIFSERGRHAGSPAPLT